MHAVPAVGKALRMDMTTAKWCLLIACFLPVLTALMPKVHSLKLSADKGKYDNNQPRQWAATLGGWQQRAMAAHANGFEILPLFVGALLFAQLGHMEQSRIDLLALGFVVLRLLYIALYLLNLGTLRTLVWTAGVGCCIALLLL
jgi:uncharacterized MAPEG superfamily protein